MAKQLPAFALLLWVLPALLHASSPRDPWQSFFEQSLGDLTEELEIASDAGKKALQDALFAYRATKKNEKQEHTVNV